MVSACSNGLYAERRRMEIIDQKKYLKGKKQFRILAILNIQMFLMSDLMLVGNSKVPIGITQVMFFTRMYWGEIWPIYFVIVLSILVFHPASF